MTAMQKSLPEGDVSGLCLYSVLCLCYSNKYRVLALCVCVCMYVYVCVFVCTFRYLIQELHRAVSGADNSVFCPAKQQGKWSLQPGVSFVFFTSHTPCESSMPPVHHRLSV